MFPHSFTRRALLGLGLSLGLLAALPVHWRFFVKTKLFAAMRETANAGDVATAFTAVRRDYPQVPEVV